MWCSPWCLWSFPISVMMVQYGRISNLIVSVPDHCLFTFFAVDLSQTRDCSLHNYKHQNGVQRHSQPSSTDKCQWERIFTVAIQWRCSCVWLPLCPWKEPWCIIWQLQTTLTLTNFQSEELLMVWVCSKATVIPKQSDVEKYLHVTKLIRPLNMLPLLKMRNDWQYS